MLDSENIMDKKIGRENAEGLAEAVWAEWEERWAHQGK